MLASKRLYVNRSGTNLNGFYAERYLARKEKIRATITEEEREIYEWLKGKYKRDLYLNRVYDWKEAKKMCALCYEITLEKLHILDDESVELSKNDMIFQRMRTEAFNKVDEKGMAVYRELVEMEPCPDWKKISSRLNQLDKEQYYVVKNVLLRKYMDEYLKLTHCYMVTDLVSYERYVTRRKKSEERKRKKENRRCS